MFCTSHTPYRGMHMAHNASGCCCTPSAMFHPRSKKHKIKMLKKYLEGLKEEVQDIEEFIKELEKEQ